MKLKDAVIAWDGPSYVEVRDYKGEWCEGVAVVSENLDDMDDLLILFNMLTIYAGIDKHEVHRAFKFIYEYRILWEDLGNIEDCFKKGHMDYLCENHYYKTLKEEAAKDEESLNTEERASLAAQRRLWAAVHELYESGRATEAPKLVQNWERRKRGSDTSH